MARKQRDTMYYSDLYNVFPGLVRKSVKAAALGPELSGHIVLHEETANVVLVHNTNTAELNRLYLESAFDTAKDKIMKRFSSSETKTYKMCSEFAHENWVAFYQQGGSKIDVIDLLNGSAFSLELPIQMASLHLVASDAWLVTEVNSIGKYLLTKPSPDAPVSQLSAINELLEDVASPSKHITWDQLSVSTEPLNKDTLSHALGQNIEAPNRILASQGNYGNIAVGFPQLMSGVEVYTIPRQGIKTEAVESSNGSDPLAVLLKKSTPVQEKESDGVMLPEAGQIIRCVPVNMVPKDVFPENKVPITITAALEVVDLADHKVRYIPLPSDSSNVSRLMPWAPTSSNEQVMATTHDEHLVTVDRSGTVRVWETGTKQLMKSLDEWHKMIGADGNRPLQITREKELGKDITSPPKHGKIDPKNTPHVGGNQWAGGTGGQGTAGLGGVGGPYRLDAGHDVFQVSDLDKENVPPEILAAAREMAQKAFKERLREIDMSDYDADMYEKFSSNVRRQVKSLKVILESLQAKGKERQWLKHQSAGELDETKLIEGLTGEKSIYKRRGDKEPEPGSPQVKPKRLRLVVDVSGSMYRFNGYDGRLDRVMESTLMVMEAFEKYDEKFTIDIVGHSGEDFNIVFVNGEKPPKNNKERLNVIKRMHAHAQFCMSGDNTLEAAKFAVEDITNKDGDEYFVIVLSDANLDRYAISPSRFSQILTSDEQVNAYALFIGSLGNQADVLVHKLPAGKGFVCMDLKEIPQILQKIFTSTFLSS